jgi:hypothetical protein
MRDRRMFEAVDGAATVAEKSPEVAASGESAPDDHLWRGAAAAEILSWRHQVLTDLQTKGVLVLDVMPENLTAPLVNRYLEVKARHLL